MSQIAITTELPIAESYESPAHLFPDHAFHSSDHESDLIRSSDTIVQSAAHALHTIQNPQTSN